jgi:hypothetical protein
VESKIRNHEFVHDNASFGCDRESTAFSGRGTIGFIRE